MHVGCVTLARLMSSGSGLSLRVRADGGALFLAATYDETLKAMIKALPDRRWDRGLQEWIVPAGRENRRAVLDLIARLEEQGVVVEIDVTARGRFTSLGVTRVLLRDPDTVELVAPYDPEALPALRRLPERSFDTVRKSWVVPLTKEGALRTLKLIEDADRHLVTERARAALISTAQPAPAVGTPVDESERGHHKSPIAHWRRVTKGAIFNARPLEQVWWPEPDHPDGGYWYVPIRVDPERRHRKHADNGAPRPTRAERA